MTTRTHEETMLAVIDALADRDIYATYEYPGVVAIHLTDGWSWWTGMHGWDYASAVTPEGDESRNDDAHPYIDTLPMDEVLLDPTVVADAWAAEVAAR